MTRLITVFAVLALIFVLVTATMDPVDYTNMMANLNGFVTQLVFISVAFPVVLVVLLILGFLAGATNLNFDGVHNPGALYYYLGVTGIAAFLVGLTPYYPDNSGYTITIMVQRGIIALVGSGFVGCLIGWLGMGITSPDDFWTKVKGEGNDNPIGFVMGLMNLAVIMIMMIGR